MKRWLAFTVIPLCAAAGSGLRARAAEISADSARGAQVFELQGCSGCHVLNGVDKAIGPDLGRIADRGFTPASLAATMWNHAPAMWVETKLRSVARPTMDEQQATDLFAFFYSLRFFEEPGDAGRCSWPPYTRRQGYADEPNPKSWSPWRQGPQYSSRPTSKRRAAPKRKACFADRRRAPQSQAERE